MKRANTPQPGFVVRGPEESALYGLLIRWAEANPFAESGWTEAELPSGHKKSLKQRVHLFLRQFDYRYGG